ncbi:MAG: glycosyltransferase family 4 protein [Rhodopirellula sp.]|nr:glycosyltransferase family 4 protein [Rhodopirellula sp.]
MRPLRLVIVARRFWPLVGETERMLASLASAFPVRDCRVTVLTAGWNPRWPPQVVYGEVPVIRLSPAPRDGWSTLRYLRTLGGWLRRHGDDYDAVYVSGLKQEAYAAVRAVGRRRPVVLRAEQAGRGGDCLWQIDAFCGRRVKTECLRARLFVGRTPGVCRELVAAGYPRHRIRYVPDGVSIPPQRDWDRKAAAREALAGANPSLRVPPWAPVALFAGPLQRSQGLGGLLDAWAPVSRRWPNARLWLVGAGPFHAELSERIEAGNLSDRVILAGQFDTLDEFLAAADLFLLPPQEGIATAVLLEAMAAGLPIVASDLVDHRDFAADREHALIVPRGNSRAIAEAVIRVWSDAELGLQLGEAARTRVIRQFSLARMADSHLELFKGLVDSA